MTFHGEAARAQPGFAAGPVFGGAHGIWGVHRAFVAARSTSGALAGRAVECGLTLRALDQPVTLPVGAVLGWQLAGPRA